MPTGTASADPARLEAAAQAVPAELAAVLSTAPAGLSEKIAGFNAGDQSPERIAVSDDAHAGAMSRTVSRGAELDLHLIRVAAAFRVADGGRPPGFTGPPLPGLRYVDEAALTAELGRWADTSEFRFQQRPDGGFDVVGPGGQTFALRDGPPPGAVPLDQRQQVSDLGNPAFGLVMGAAIMIGLTGGSSQPVSRPAPPQAYEFVQLTPDGFPVAGPDVAGHSPRPGSLPPGDAGASRAEAIGLVGGGMYEAGKHASARYRNVFRTQATFYVDPRTGERVAVVDAASIRYDNDNNEATVTSGRLSVDGDGRPTIVARPPEVDPDAAACPTGPGGPGASGGSRAEPATTLRIPLQED
jgi:hypothetical protein